MDFKVDFYSIKNANRSIEREKHLHFGHVRFSAISHYSLLLFNTHKKAKKPLLYNSKIEHLFNNRKKPIIIFNSV